MPNFPRFRPRLAYPFRRYGRALAIFTLLSAGISSSNPGFAQSVEYRVKAAFIFNFARFVEWPPSASNQHTPIDLAIWAPDEPYEVIAAALADKVVGKRKVRVGRFNPDGPMPHILFVHDAQEPIPQGLQRRLVAAHVLVVGQSTDFAAKYGIIGLVPRGDSLRFQINLHAAERSGLRLSGQLARLAEIVKDQP
ncbi:YfiR family protein [Synoicihabitans lomoniglobus]|uniref:YfiR family protein n=1 Tax=Synoicihabitans lomoniglobus TaxID=2909285 RepID=A0AAE9ZTV8_9BACT|nr:YfiR family protein [Opitutaceae bacterium LMO-M01]WED63206.1 YfiR family protein [Opitutaceae bacterium LMO-M01]